MATKDIEYWKKMLAEFAPTDAHLQRRRFEVLKDIDFLESIYMTGGKYNHIGGQEFKDAAYNARQELCLVSSAIYETIREREAAKQSAA